MRRVSLLPLWMGDWVWAGVVSLFGDGLGLGRCRPFGWMVPVFSAAVFVMGLDGPQ